MVAARARRCKVEAGRTRIDNSGNPPDHTLMSKKEVYIPVEETKALAAEKGKQSRVYRITGEILGKPLADLGFVEIDMTDAIAAAIAAVDKTDESELTEYVNRCLENIDLVRQRMNNDQIEIDRLREETRALLASITVG